jgi:hypothetical protein
VVSGFHCVTTALALITPPKWPSFFPPPSSDPHLYDSVLKSLKFLRITFQDAKRSAEVSPADAQIIRDQVLRTVHPT